MSTSLILKNSFTDKQFAATLPDAVMVLDVSHCVLWWNPAAKKLLKLNKQTLGTSILEIFPQKQFQDYLKSFDLKKSLEINAPKDKNIHLAVQIFPYGKTALLLIARNVTHTYHLEKMRQDFVANVSHELRTPLTVFRGYLELLLEKENRKKTQLQVMLRQMYAQSVRMERIIEDLLLLSRLEIDLPDAEALAAIHMKDLLQAIYRDALALSGDRKHHIHLKITGPRIFYGKQEELRSAFSNLVFNAVNYTPREGHIYMSWYQNKSGMHFSVRDTGIGIEAKHIPRLTERFYRVDAGRTRDTGGTGLGLAIVKHVLLRHRAHLFIKSVIHRGSVFRCDFH